MIRRSLFRILIPCFVLILSIGCRNQIENHRSGVAVSVEEENEGFLSHNLQDEFNLSTLNNLNWSILPEIARAKQIQNSQAISYPICIYTVSGSMDEAKRQTLLQHAEQSMNMWNQALIAYNGWEVTYIQPRLVGSSYSCPATDGGLKVYKVRMDLSLSRTGAEYWEFTFSMGSDYYSSMDMRVFAHEFGHQIGLGDTYYEVGYQQPVDQPAGLMNSLYAVNSLTEDDIAGVRHVWDLVRGATTAQCPQGYTYGQVNENRLGHLFCVKDNYSPNPSPNPGPNPSPDPSTGASIGLSNLFQDTYSSLCLTTNGSMGACADSQWVKIDRDDGLFQIRDELSGKCLVAADAANIRAENCGNYSGHLWRINNSGGSGYFQITNYWQQGKCLNLRALNGSAGLDPCQQLSGQFWNLDEGSMSDPVVGPSPDPVVDPAQDSSLDLSNLFQDSSSSLCLTTEGSMGACSYAEWTKIDIGNGLFQIKDTLSGKCLVAADANNIRTENCGNYSGHLWSQGQSASGYDQIKNYWQQDKCLNLPALQGAANLDSCKQVSGQYWKL